MLKKTITYTDYNGLERTEDFYFNLSKSELMQWQFGVEGGLTEVINKIINAKDAPEIIGYFQELILKSYGEKSDDGKRFMKSKEISEAFSQTEAYDQLYMELFTNEDVAADFVKAILPKDIEKELSNLEAKQPNLQTISEMSE